MRKAERSARGRRARERFADVVAGATPGDEFNRELSVVDELRAAGNAAGQLDSSGRARIAALIKAGRTRRPTGHRETERSARFRAADLLAAAIAALLAAGGLGLLLSKDALPGDTLYQVKRAGERTSLALTFSESAHADRRLELTGQRIAELPRLISDPARYRSALTDLDADSRDTARELTTLASGADGTALGALSVWARTGIDALTELTAVTPEPARGQHREVTDTLRRIDQRARDLWARMPCYRITSGAADDLGVLPATGECRQTPAPMPSTPTQPPSGPAPAPSESPLGYQATEPVQVQPDSPSPTPRLDKLPAPHQATSATMPSPASRPRLPDAPVPPPPDLRLGALVPGLPDIRIG